MAFQFPTNMMKKEEGSIHLWKYWALFCILVYVKGEKGRLPGTITPMAVSLPHITCSHVLLFLILTLPLMSPQLLYHPHPLPMSQPQLPFSLLFPPSPPNSRALKPLPFPANIHLSNSFSFKNNGAPSEFSVVLRLHCPKTNAPLTEADDSLCFVLSFLPRAQVRLTLAGHRSGSMATAHSLEAPTSCENWQARSLLGCCVSTCAIQSVWCRDTTSFIPICRARFC